MEDEAIEVKQLSSAAGCTEIWNYSTILSHTPALWVHMWLGLPLCIKEVLGLTHTTFPVPHTWILHLCMHWYSPDIYFILFYCPSTVQTHECHDDA